MYWGLSSPKYVFIPQYCTFHSWALRTALFSCRLNTAIIRNQLVPMWVWESLRFTCWFHSIDSGAEPLREGKCLHLLLGIINVWHTCRNILYLLVASIHILIKNKNMPLVWPSPLILKCLEPNAAPNSWNTTCYSKIDTKILSLFIRNKTVLLFLTSFVSIKWSKIDGMVFFLILHWVPHYTAVMIKSGVFTKSKSISSLQEPLKKTNINFTKTCSFFICI